MKKIIYLTAVICAVFMAAISPAGEMTQMDEVVVTATKTEEKRKDIPNAMIVVDSIDIVYAPAQGIGDLLGGEPGIDWRTRGDYSGANQEIHIRGMGADGTQVMVNGLIVNSPSLGTADISKIPTDAIDRIEVVKGSGSVLYGSGAMSGIVNVITKSPEPDQTDLEITAGYGTENTFNTSIQNGMFLTEQFGYYLTAGFEESDGFRDNADGDQKHTSLKLMYDIDDTFSLSLYGDYNNRETGRPGPKPPQGTTSFSVNGIEVYNQDSTSLLNRVDEEDKHVVLTMKTRPVNWADVTLQADYTDMLSENYTRRYSATVPGNLPGSTTEVTNEVMGFEGHVELTPYDNATMLVGAQHKIYDWENISTDLDGFGNPSSALTGKEDLHTTGLFTEVQYRPWDFFKASAGIRHEDHSQFGSELLPRLGLVLNPADTTAIKFNIGRHFKAPTPNDLFWPFEDWGWGMGAQGNSSLKPETGKHTDIGIEHTAASDKIFLSLVYFMWDIEDKISWIPDSNFFYRPENLSEYNADGIEIAAVVGPFYQTTLSLNYTYTDATEQKTGGVERQARYTSDHFFKAKIDTWFDFGLNLSAVLRYTGERPSKYTLDTDTEPVRYLDDYVTVDVKAVQEISEHWSVSVQVNNLFDESYDTYVENFYDQYGNSTLSAYPGAGCSVFIGLKYQF